MCVPYEEEDTCHEHFSVGAHALIVTFNTCVCVFWHLLPYEEEDTCVCHMRRRIHVCVFWHPLPHPKDEARDAKSILTQGHTQKHTQHPNHHTPSVPGRERDVLFREKKEKKKKHPWSTGGE